MDTTIEYIEKNLTKGKLEELSLIVIDSYRNDNMMVLRSCAGALLGPDASEGKDRKALFFQLIKLVHPDRLPVLLEAFRTARDARDEQKLSYLKTLLSLRKKAAEEKKERLVYPHEEEYGWEPDIYEDLDIRDEPDAETREEDLDLSFLDAVKLYLFGNLDFDLTPFDLGQLEGALDLTGYDLYETDGLEYCRGITELDLSLNCLDNIYDLQFLTHLRELYLANNRIASIDDLAGLDELEILDLENNEVEDISVLLTLESLKLVTLRKNPLRSSDTVEALKRKGVAVL